MKIMKYLDVILFALMLVFVGFLLGGVFAYTKSYEPALWIAIVILTLTSLGYAIWEDEQQRERRKK